ncbi:MAG: uroporphyrinogen decarboxylase family protein [Actinomycetota bacterium]|nr:MAG: uroporphyrinogen [Actinomycetota bacterium]MDO8949134.1 uroporphyrinogen decarboxylase family protein [Actinomycetota bacterium]MDP3631544.1 uroporphyrinogen decarboxylase family protein [Actinomycetota bacterium]
MGTRLPYGTPFGFGLTFVSPEALAAFAPEGVSPVEALVGACKELDAAFAFVPSWETWAPDAVTALRTAGVSVFWAVEGPLWPVLEVRGLQDGLRATLTHPDDVAREMRDGVEQVIADVHRGLVLGVSAVVIAEDLAGSEGPLVAPDFAIDVLTPMLAEIVGVANGFGAPTVLHSDGEIRWLLPAIKRAGFAGIHGGGGLSFDAFERLFRAAHALEIAVIGGLPTADLLGGTAQAEMLGSRVGMLARAGGLLVADDGGITTKDEVLSLRDALVVARAAAGGRS